LISITIEGKHLHSCQNLTQPKDFIQSQKLSSYLK